MSEIATKEDRTKMRHKKGDIHNKRNSRINTMQNKIFLKTHISWFFEDSNKQTKLWERKREKQNQTILEMESVR